jgi:hypothetical protein
MAGVKINVKHSIGDETEHRGTWTFDAAGGGPTYPAGGISYVAKTLGFNTLQMLRVDPIVMLGGVAVLVYHDWVTQHLVLCAAGTGAPLAPGTDVSTVQLGWAALGR